METVFSSLTKFLGYHQGQGVAPDLLARWSPAMETQVNVHGLGGRPVEDRAGSYTNGLYEWWPIRIPKQADGGASGDPHFRDYRIDWPFDLHAEAIGSTGWDWQARRSRWVGFDFDAITGHAAGVGIGDDELAAVKEKASAIPWVQVRRSTGGKGLHLYVYLDVPTENHTIHAALARCVLGLMSAETGFDFARHVDCCGGNLWLWRRNLPEGGLSLLKNHEHELVDLPVNWRDHVEVKDISQAPGATNKIKEWVNGKNISIRKMRTDSYSQPNTTHWMQCGNSRQNCPVFPGDSRITMIQVLRPDVDIPKTELLLRLAAEGPHFLRTLLDLDLPPVICRLRLPVVETDQKKQAAANASSALQRFMAAEVDIATGEFIRLEEFWNRLERFLLPDELPHWTREKVELALRPTCHKTTTRGKGKLSHVTDVRWKRPEQSDFLAC